MRHRFSGENCSVARALEVLGDWWTLLIVREAFLGTRRFTDFETRLDISKNILARRLEHLVDHGVLTREDVGRHGAHFEYALTAAGKDLLTVLTALRQWGDRWVFGPGHEPALLCDAHTGRPIPRLRVLDEDGAPLSGERLTLVAGPGATAETRARFEALGPPPRR